MSCVLKMNSFKINIIQIFGTKYSLSIFSDTCDQAVAILHISTSESSCDNNLTYMICSAGINLQMRPVFAFPRIDIVLSIKFKQQWHV